jgi:hypothetical protein
MKGMGDQIVLYKCDTINSLSPFILGQFLIRGFTGVRVKAKETQIIHSEKHSPKRGFTVPCTVPWKRKTPVNITFTGV